jgi:filamentous hemagglutinin family protein
MHWRDRLYPFGLVGVVTLAGVGMWEASFSWSAVAQPVPDDSLGVERSEVVGGGGNFGIVGGATRGTNLFHSFQEFNVDNGGSVYFLNPAGIENILSRVTGNNPSAILGTLGVFGGDANLFLMNPNGIVFGPNARLDVQGSFVATTADAIGFGNQGVFSAIDPDVPSQLLTVNPSAFFFNQVSTGNITVQSNTPIFPTLGINGLFVPPGENLTLLGGDISIEGGRLNAFGGRIDIGAVNGIGAIGLSADGSLVFPTEIRRGDVTFTDSARLDTRTFESGGDIAVIAQSIALDDASLLRAGILPGQGSLQGQAGNVLLDATGQVTLSAVSSISNNVGSGGSGHGGNIDIRSDSLSLNGSQLDASTFGEGNAGLLTIQTEGDVRIDSGSFVLNSGERDAVGNSGGISINARSLILSGDSQILSGILGQGTAGDIIIRATDFVRLTGSADPDNPRFTNAIFNRIEPGGRGVGGNITIETGSLFLTGSQISASTFGRGNAGSVHIRARDSVTLTQGSGIFSAVNFGGVGDGGTIEVEAGSLSISDRSQLQTIVRSAFADFPAGQGNAGDITVRVRGDVTISDRDRGGRLLAPGGIFSAIDAEASGQAGNINISAGTLTITDFAQVRSTLDAGATGASGTIDINVGSLSMSNSAQVNTFTAGQGNAGDIFVNATGGVILNGRNTIILSEVTSVGRGDGGNITINANSLTLSDRAEVSTSVNRSQDSLNVGQGNAGDITANIQGTLIITDSARLNARTLGSGEAGDIDINAEQTWLRNAGGVLSTTTTDGDAGNISINTNRLIIQDGSFVLVDALGGSTGSSGNLTVDATESVEIVGASPITQEGDVSDASGLYAQTRSTGNAGNLRLTTRRLSIRDGGTISAETSGSGDGGDIFINASDWIEVAGGSPNQTFSSSINAGVEPDASGDAGNVTIFTGQLIARDGGFVTSSARSNSTGNAGSVVVNASDSVELIGRTLSGNSPSAISVAADVGAAGNTGSLNINTGRLSLREGAAILAQNFGTGQSGSIQISATDAVDLRGSSTDSTLINASSGSFATGQPANVQITTRHLRLQDGGQIFAGTFGQVDAGEIRIRATDSIDISGRSPVEGIPTGIVATTIPFILGDAGQGGNIDIQTGNLQISDTGQISASTFGQASAGNISIRANTISLDRATISTTVNPRAIGQGGDITLRTGSLNLNNRSQISAATFGAGRAGNIFVEDAERISLLSGSSISTEVGESAIGRGGNISLNSSQISIDGNRSRLTASTAGRGRAGEINIDADRVSLTEGGRIISSTASTRRAGSITLNVQDIVSIDGRGSGLFANTLPESSGRGGNIRLNTTDLQLLDRARISAQSQGTGSAGEIEINARGNVTLRDRSRISTESQADGAVAGTIRMDAGGNITLSDRSTISTRSQGENAEAGNIQLTVGNTFAASNSDITTSAENASGGDIRLTSSNIRLLGNTNVTTDSAVNGGNITFRANSIRTFGNSDIIATAGEQGGNILLSADSILAFGDSDIIAAAEKRGGNIILDTPVFFGEGFTSDSTDADPSTLDGNDRVDINASGQISSGNIERPDTGFVQDSLADLPESAIDTESLIAASCVVRSQEPGGTFIITGRGGLPERPGEGGRSIYSTGEVRSIPESSETSWQIGDPIVEPQGMYQLEDGRIVLSQECD